MKPGLYSMSYKDYDKIDAFHYSAVKHLLRSPAHYMYNMINPDDPSPPMKLGGLVDTLILTPNEFDDNYVTLPTTYVNSKKQTAAFTMRSSTCREIYDGILAAGKIPVTQDEIIQADTIRESLNVHRDLIASCKKQVVVIWEKLGVLCKARLDMYNEDERFIVDLKTTNNASPEVFKKYLFNFGYHIQAALYIDGLFSQVGELDLNPYRLLCVETDPPFCSSYFQVEPESILTGRHTYLKALRIYKECKENNHWPGYSRFLEPIEIPAYGMCQDLTDEDYNE